MKFSTFYGNYIDETEKRKLCKDFFVPIYFVPSVILSTFRFFHDSKFSNSDRRIFMNKIMLIITLETG